MRALFADLLRIDGVKGVALFTLSGQPLFEEFRPPLHDAARTGNWFALAACLGNAPEMELVFESGRLYVRQGAEGVLLVLMALIAPAGMVRLTADILFSGLRQPKPARGLKRFFKR